MSLEMLLQVNTSSQSCQTHKLDRFLSLTTILIGSLCEFLVESPSQMKWVNAGIHEYFLFTSNACIYGISVPAAVSSMLVYSEFYVYSFLV